MLNRWLPGVMLGGGVAAIAYWRRALTLDGALAAAPIGAIVYARGGRAAVASLLAFFVSSSALSRFGEHRKQALPLAQSKGARRDAWQVLANGGVATLALVAGHPGGFVGAIAAACADTWATELGVLAPRRPRLITTLRAVAPGTSGGITPEGVLAGAAGALLVGAAYAGCAGGRPRVTLTMLTGVAASLADSVLGATLQAAYYCPRCEHSTEQSTHSTCGMPARLVHGLAWMNNDVVNALATLIGAGLGALSWTPNAAEHVRGGS